VDKIAEWPLLNVTFGGGDPLMYPYFCDLVHYTRTQLGKHVLIQVDTNGIKLGLREIERLRTDINIIGLPLETTVPGIALEMRKNAKHPATVLNLLHTLTNRNVPTKINTVVTKRNIGELTSLAETLAAYPLRVWSLYQFWPVGPVGNQEHTKDIVEDQQFMDAVLAVRNAFPSLPVERGLIEDRSRSYLFVTQTGRAYTVAAEMNNQYVELGPIFEPSVLEKWRKHADPAANGKRASDREKVVRVD